jgi:hypothetical protein
LNYIQTNPVEARYVFRPEEYYWFIRNFSGLDAPLEIIFESLELKSEQKKLNPHASEIRMREPGLLKILLT